MSEKTAKDQDPKPDLNPDSPVESSEDVLANIDQLLAAEDPDFLKKLSDIKIDSSQVAVVDVDGTTIDIERHITQSFSVYAKKPFEFKTNPKPVATFWAIVLFGIVILIFVWKNKSNLLHEELFISSYEQMGDKTNSYNPNSDLEAFYDNPRFAKNLISMSPVHVNLKPSETSGDNPMLAFEVTVEGLSADAIIEIKDRQAEFKDMLSRLAEQKKYDELVLAEGKRILCDQFRDLLNANLTQGQVRRVLLKSFIIKP